MGLQQEFEDLVTASHLKAKMVADVHTQLISCGFNEESLIVKYQWAEEENNNALTALYDYIHHKMIKA